MGFVPLAVATLLLLAAGACGEASELAVKDDAGGASSVSPSPEPEETPDEDPGFRPPSTTQEGVTLMPLTFVDGSSAEVVADAGLGIEGMTAAIYTSGGIGDVDRTIDFQYGEGSVFMHEGPLETYEGSDGSTVELWDPIPDMPAGCPHLVYRFEEWFVGVRTCQRDLSVSDKETWARSLQGRIADGGFLVLSSASPLVLQETGGHEGPELILGRARADWIEMEPGACDPAEIPDEGDIRTMTDGTRVSFSQIGGAGSKIEFNWSVTWCEDGLMTVQVVYAYKDFAEAAAEGFRLRNIALPN